MHTHAYIYTNRNIDIHRMVHVKLMIRRALSGLRDDVFRAWRAEVVAIVLDRTLQASARVIQAAWRHRYEYIIVFRLLLVIFWI